MDDHTHHDDPEESRDSTPPANVVSLEEAKRARGASGGKKKAAVGALPELTGVAQMGEDMLLANLRASELTDETIDAARLFVLPSAKWRTYGFKSARPQSGLLFPFFEPRAQQPFAYRIKPTYPLPSRRKANGKPGKPKKYDQAYDTELLVYMPPLAATLDALQDITRPLIWTEGEKKALLLAQLGYCVVGLTGVSCWHDKAARDRGEGYKWHPFIAKHYALAGRQHVIVFDSDARDNDDVQRAIGRLAGMLSHSGAASVHVCLPPPGTEKGIDDYAHAHGIAAAANLLATVREPAEEIEPDLGCIPLSRFKGVFEGSGAERLRMPRGYDCERDGSIWLCEDPTDPDNKRLALDAPMVLTRRLTDVYTGALRTEVRFRDARRQWQRVLVPREKLGDRTLVSELRPYGALVNISSAQATMKFLDAFERDNGDLIEQARCAATTGWHDGQFVLPDTIAPRSAEVIQLDGTPEQLRVFNALTPAPTATVEGHVEALRVPMMASPECALAVYAAMAAPLLHLLKQGNFALHLCGDSSRGKTSMLRVAASVFGDPRNPGWVASWNATSAGIEQRASQLCDLPQLYDEVGVVALEQAQENVYTLVNGEGRLRSTKELRTRETLRWRTVVLSTGEPELADATTAATGAQARVINLQVHGFGEMGALEINAAVAGCIAQHGAVGRDWLEWLVGLGEEDLVELRALYAGYLAELTAIADRNGDRLGGRIAGYFATMAVVEAQLAHEWGLGEQNAGIVRRVFESRSGDEGQRVQPLAERVVESLRDWVASAPSCFPSATGVDADATRVCGYRKGDLIGFLRTPLLEHLRSLGLSWTRSLQRELREAGVLVVETSQRSRGEDRMRFMVRGERINVLAMRLQRRQEDLSL